MVGRVIELFVFWLFFRIVISVCLIVSFDLFSVCMNCGLLFLDGLKWVFMWCV